MQDSNCPGGEPATISAELHDKIMAVLPREIADWLRYEAASDYCVVEVWEVWREGRRPHALLSQMRAWQCAQTRKIYGPVHP
jgi:hypothetical protein